MSAAVDATRPESRAPSKVRARRGRGKGQIVPINAPVTAPYQDDSPASWLAFISRAMADPATDVGKLEILVGMRRDILATEARHEFNVAMSATQAEMVPVVRDAENKETGTRYARLETIDAMLRPIYTRHGFCLSYDTVPLEGPDVRVACEVSHSGRHSKTYILDACLDVTGPKGTTNKTPIHGLASSISYLRRYLLCMIFHVVLVHDDTDGNQNGLPSNVHVPQTPKTEPAIANDELYALLAQCSADPAAVAANEARFLQRMGVGNVRSLADVQPADREHLKSALLAKRARLARTREVPR